MEVSRMIIILEGPDGAGKTTLATQLSLMTKYKVVHYSYPKNQEEADRMYINYISDLKKAGNIIIDRCWYSDMTYGPVMRGGATITYPEMFDLERIVARKGGMIIYCTDSKAALWQRVSRRGDDYVKSKEQFDAIWDNYEKLFSCPHMIPVMRYSFETIY